MMQLQSIGYSVFFQKNNFSEIQSFLTKQSYTDLFIFCDTHTFQYCLPLLQKKVAPLKKAKVLSLAAGEKHKTLDTTQRCWNFLAQNQADRNALVICLGGGVICDMGAFAAATFKRGLSFINIPTTLLAMADASVGGKNGVDFLGFKNLIGTITQPKAVFIQEEFLKTLPPRHLKNGFAEICKAALIGDKKLWEKCLPLQKIQGEKLYALIAESVSIKNKIVKKDPFEKNIRQALNFGHTAGHAIESYYLNKKNSVLHGEAIVMGMCVELCLSELLGISAARLRMEVFIFFKKHYVLKKFSETEIHAFLQAMKYDKKNKAGKLVFALLAKTGKPCINIQVREEEIKQAFYQYNQLL